MHENFNFDKSLLKLNSRYARNKIAKLNEKNRMIYKKPNSSSTVKVSLLVSEKPSNEKKNYVRILLHDERGIASVLCAATKELERNQFQRIKTEDNPKAYPYD